LSLSPEIQDVLVRVLLILAIIIATIWTRRIAPYFARRVIKIAWRGLASLRAVGVDLDEPFTNALIPPIRLLITTIGLQGVLLVLELSSALRDFGEQIVSSLTIFIVFWIVYRLVDVVAPYLEAANRLPSLDHTIMRFATQLTKFVIIIFGFVVVMGEWGYDLAGLVAGLGIGGLAVALAAQDALSNLIGYFVIMADAPFKVGHLVIIDDEEGFVEDISFRSTRIRKRDRSLIIIPNQTVVSSKIINWSRLNKRQLKLILGVTYSTTEEQLTAIIDDIRAMLDDHERVTQDRKLVEFVEFGASSLDILIICFVNTVMWEELQRIKMEINLKLMGILKRHDVEVAFPTRTVVLEHSTPAIEPTPDNLQTMPLE
jgi:MscS family membrane protein